VARIVLNFDKLQVGDFFHAVCPNRASLICLVTAVTDAEIYARRVTTQDDLVFDRRTGITVRGPVSAPGTIISVAPLPVDIHSIMLELDRRYRLGQEPDRFKLTDVEKQAFIFLNDYYPVVLP
jgi:hypothetical protein